MTLRIGIIGYGYWGPNLLRNFVDAPGVEVAAVADLRPERLQRITKLFPSVRVTTDHRDLINDAAIDAIVIATPVSSHFPLSMEALRAGKHVFVEKPLASTADEAKRLVDEAASRRLILHVDHTFVYTGAVRKMRELIESGSVGNIYYYDSVRVNLGLFQHDVSVMWDLAVHDLSIMQYALRKKPIAVSATGMSHVAGQPENIAYLTLFFDDSLIAHFHVNWLAPVKIRRTLVGGSRQMIVFDDLEASEKIKVYDSGITVTDDPLQIYQMLVGYRTGDVWSPKLEVMEALQIEARHFAECVTTGRPSLTSGEEGLEVVRLLETATRSMQQRGAAVEVER